MQVFYEEDGGFKVGAVLADNDTSLQVEAPHGKRSKIKSAAVMLRFEQPSLTEFMQSVDKETQSLDVDFLWECCGENEFAFADLGRDYYGHAPTPIESAAVLTRLHGAPMYFYKRGKGRYKAAPEEALKAALAGAERKRQQDALKAQYVQSLQKGELPEAFKPILQDLLYKPDKNSLEYKALDAAATAAKQTPLQVLAHAGGIPSTHEYHLNGFLFEYFPEGTDFPTLTIAPPATELPLASVSAFQYRRCHHHGNRRCVFRDHAPRQYHTSRHPHRRAGAGYRARRSGGPHRAAAALDHLYPGPKNHHAAGCCDRAIHP